MSIRPSPTVIAVMDYERRRLDAEEAVSSGRLSIKQAAATYDLTPTTIYLDLRRTQILKEQYGEEPF